MSHFYPGLTPPVIDEMTHREVSEYISQMNTYLAEQQRQRDH